MYTEGISNAKSELVLLEWTPGLCLRFEACQHFIIAMYGYMNYSLLMPNLLAFYAKLNKI